MDNLSVFVAAVGMTLVILVAEIDISIAAQLAVCGVVAGSLSRLGLPIIFVIPITVICGGILGLINGFLVARLKIPSIVATLAVWVLLENGLLWVTNGEWIQNLGNDFQWFGLSSQNGQIVFILIAVFVAVFIGWILIKTEFGRNFYAVGCSHEAAQRMKISPAKTIIYAFVILGMLMGLAAIIHYCRFPSIETGGGRGIELKVIASVVVGGTAITGGRGSMFGTFLGVLLLAVVGSVLAFTPLGSNAEKAVQGAIILLAVIANTAFKKVKFKMKNSQLAVLCIVILAAAGIISISNHNLSKSLCLSVQKNRLSAINPKENIDEKVTIAMLPKTKTDPYFVSCREGAEAAAKELGIDLIWDGPTKGDPEKQTEIIEAWITKNVDVICASVLNRDAIDGVLKKAIAKGIKVITWDADANKPARDFFINQATSEGIGYTLADEIATLCGDKGEYVIISAGTTDANQNEWIVYIKERMKDKHPKMVLKEIRYSEGVRDKAMTETRNVLNKYPNLKGILAIAAPAVPGAAEGLKQANRSDIKLSGLSVPSLCKKYVHEDFIDSIILWNTVDLGYLTVQAAKFIQEGKLNKKSSNLNFGRLKSIKIGDGNVYLGEPFIFRKDNIDNFDF